jgi:glucose-6-phosphate 1-dehydrogenase
MVEASWRVVQPVLDAWKPQPPEAFPNYAAGSWGPEKSFELLRRDGREWRDPTACNPAKMTKAPGPPAAK